MRKGLEFPYVFLCSMNEGIFPSRKCAPCGNGGGARLAFVALTRAERGLVPLGSGRRNFDGSPRYPSRFLLEIDPSLLSFTEPPEEGLLQEAQNFIRHSQSLLPEEEAPILPEGQRVRHFLFGEGTVLETDRDKGAYVIQFDGMATPRKISFRVKLELC